MGQLYVLPVVVAAEIANFYNDCMVMEDASYNLQELVGHMARGPIVWDHTRSPILAKDDTGPVATGTTGQDIAIMNDALTAYYNATIHPHLGTVGNNINQISLDERRGVMSILYE